MQGRLPDHETAALHHTDHIGFCNKAQLCVLNIDFDIPEFLVPGIRLREYKGPYDARYGQQEEDVSAYFFNSRVHITDAVNVV